VSFSFLSFFLSQETGTGKGRKDRQTRALGESVCSGVLQRRPHNKEQMRTIIIEVLGTSLYRRQSDNQCYLVLLPVNHPRIFVTWNICTCIRHWYLLLCGRL